MCAFQLPKNEIASTAGACPFLHGQPAAAGITPVTAPINAGHPHGEATIAAPHATGLAGLFLVGLNHHTAEVGLRERFFTEQVELLLIGLRALGLPEAAVLFTCNRIEVYGTGGTAGAEAVITHFAARCGLTIDALRPHLYVAGGQDAALHLMRVAAGLESLVLGESQILGQVADAFERSQNAGTAGPVLSRVFNGAVCAGKRARTETGIGRHTLSISHAGVMLAKASRPTFDKARILIVGAGEMARLALSALRCHDGGDIRIVNRTPNRAQLLATEHGLRAVAWNNLRDALATSDVVIAATSSATPIINRMLLSERHGTEGVTLIDLGMPRNIDRDVTSIVGVELFDVDDLQQVVEQHRIHRQREVAAVETLLADEMERLLEQLRSAHLSPVIASLRQKVESVVGSELERTLSQMPNLDDQTRAAFEQMAHRIASKVLHGPTVALRSTSGPQIAPLVCEMFDLPASCDLPKCLHSKCEHHE
ncbi:MAG TPA: glutamyl-tRNA reductase [Tepidisphaeraceae bacterium]|jgi:glutamyl-tRNA reductase|nr:glutamyl-tRNA reductase [Tepidisphaeraceae bacterium]